MFVGNFWQHDDVLDERYMEDEALPGCNLTTAVIGLKQSRTPAGLERVADALGEWSREPGDSEMRRAFASPRRTGSG